MPSIVMILIGYLVCFERCKLRFYSHCLNGEQEAVNILLVSPI